MKKGFTLAETLITLGIIGVVAALTIPTLNVSTKEKSFDAMRKVCVSDLENAFTTMMASEGATDLEETKAISENNLIENLQKYIKISKKSDTECILKNGAEVVFANTSVEDGVRKITIDVNGTDERAGKPNSLGIDQFEYTLLTTGLLEEVK